ncbi:MAG TPA: hypothetical protein VEP90_19980, partial [Methylomirabilota bacterium]|nr:hypothetical protein [Methylomirabilota bacterium]
INTTITDTISRATSLGKITTFILVDIITVAKSRGKVITTTLLDTITVVENFISGIIGFHQIVNITLTIKEKLTPIRTIYRTITVALQTFITTILRRRRHKFLEYSAQLRNLADTISAIWNKDA